MTSPKPERLAGEPIKTSGDCTPTKINPAKQTLLGFGVQEKPRLTTKAEQARKTREQLTPEFWRWKLTLRGFNGITSSLAEISIIF